MPADHFRVVRQAALQPAQLERFCAINDEAFPPSERVPCSALREVIANGKRWLFAATGGGALIGFAVLLPNVVSGIHLLEFLAIDRGWRGKGVGTRMLTVIRRELGAAGGIVIEVESDEAGLPEDRSIRRRRIQFYIGNGFQLIDCPFAYAAPNQTGGANVSMKLMWLGLRDTTLPTGDRLLDCIAGIYGKSYGLAEDSPLIQAAHAAFSPRPVEPQ